MAFDPDPLSPPASRGGSRFRTGIRAGDDAVPTVSPERALAASKFLTQVFGWMAGGLALSGGIAAAVLSNEVTLQFAASWMLPLVIVELVTVIALSALLHKLSTGAAAAGFLFYSALNGLTLAPILAMYTGASVANAFFASAAAFGGMAVLGATTKRDLSGVGSFLMMGVFAILGASLVNFFLASAALDWAVSILGALIFTGLAAVDTQRFKKLGYGGFSSDREQGQWAIRGALNLYLDFINMFLFILRIFGDRR
ncbi:MAG: Bax inhibitor-1/YccA family protein [Myxococcales bacterium]|nr:Bax inhibitor-1/YccA family protein [Myxococcales bacterium]